MFSISEAANLDASCIPMVEARTTQTNAACECVRQLQAGGLKSTLAHYERAPLFRVGFSTSAQDHSAFSLGAMLATGILLDIAANGAFPGSWWFRGSALLLVATCALHGQAGRTVRVSLAEKRSNHSDDCQRPCPVKNINKLERRLDKLFPHAVH